MSDIGTEVGLSEKDIKGKTGVVTEKPTTFTPEQIQKMGQGVITPTEARKEQAFLQGQVGDLKAERGENGQVLLTNPETGQKSEFHPERSTGLLSTERFEGRMSAALTPADRKRILEEYMYSVEVTGGEGFGNADVAATFTEVIAVSIKDPDEEDKLLKYFKARSGLDALHRMWRKHTYSPEDIGKFYMLRDILFNTKNMNTIFAEMPEVQALCSEIQSNSGHYRSLFGKDGKDAGETELKDLIYATYGTNSAMATPEQKKRASIALMLTEHILQASREAERYGEVPMQGPSKTKAEQEAGKKLDGGIKGLLGLFGIKI